jgi:conjugal transfer ATP-binding protein TraC
LLRNEKNAASEHYSIDEVLSNLDEKSEEGLKIDNASEIFILINTMIRQMARSQSLTCEIENSFISEAIDIAYKDKGHNATISTVRDVLNKNDDNRAKDIARMLRPFTKEGEYASYFEGDCNVSIESYFMVFELSEIKNKKDLQGIVMQFIMFLVFQIMYMGDRKQTISIVIDEAWDLLHGEETGKFIEGLARRARKYNGNIITGTQSINDYYKTPATKAIIENSDWTCMLAQKAESVDAFKKAGRISLDDEMERTLKSLRMVEYKYSEVMIYGGGGYVVGRLIVDPYSMALYSSKAEDFNRVQELSQKGHSVRDALDIIVGNSEISEEKINKSIIKYLEDAHPKIVLEMSGKDKINYKATNTFVSDKIRVITNSLKLNRL